MKNLIGGKPRNTRLARKNARVKRQYAPPRLSKIPGARLPDYQSQFNDRMVSEHLGGKSKRYVTRFGNLMGDLSFKLCCRLAIK